MESSLRKCVQDRIMKEMLGSVKDSIGGGWKVLILDDITTRVLSSAAKMSDILDCNVSVVEDLHKPREPLPLVAVYFIQPTSRNIERILQDFPEGEKALYQAVHIFFSSQVRPKLVERIKACPSLLRVIKGLKECNLEFLTVDSRTVTTEHPDALIRLMGPYQDERSQATDISAIVARLSTLFSTMQDFPVIRYKLPPSPTSTDPPGSESRSTLTQRLATVLLERLVGMQAAGTLPSKETCDLIILDRSYDAIAPIIHEFTYEAMVYDLLSSSMDENIYRYQAESPSGKPETKEATIDERDPMWIELRHIFIAEVYAAIATRFKEFQSKNKAAKVAGSGIKDKEMGLGSMRALITALPQYHEILSRMSLHIQVSSELRSVTNARLLTDLGELEQDLVFGDKSSKELINFLAEHHDALELEDKIRLLMCFLATHPEKMDDSKREQWVKLGGLSSQDMEAVNNLAYLGVQFMKQTAEKGSGFFGKKGKEKRGGALRQPREEEDGYALFRFDPLLRGILTDMASNKLPLDDYPYIRPPCGGDADTTDRASGGSAAASARTRQPGTTGLSWAKKGIEAAGGASTGKRLFVFILGGAVRSEMRLVHQLSQQLGRDIILASSSIETPETFIRNLRNIALDHEA